MAKTAPNQTRYLRVIGRLYADNRLVLRPSYLTEKRKGPAPDRDSRLVAELYDADNKLLLRVGLSVERYLPDGPGARSDTMAVRGWVPFPPNTRMVRYVHDGIVVLEQPVGDTPPRVRLTWSPDKEISGRQEIAWQAVAKDEAPVQYFLRYSHDNGKTWHRVSMRIEGTSAVVDFDEMPGGARCRLMLVATDGALTTEVQSSAFRVPVKPCRALIVEPEDGARFDTGHVTLRGQGFWLEEGRPEVDQLSWRSSQDSEVGRGTTVDVELSPGRHQVTLRAGSGRRAGEASVTVDVGDQESQRQSPEIER